MNQFVRISKSVVNLANVTEVYLTHSAGASGSLTAIVVRFVGDTDSSLTIYKGNEHFTRLLTWMMGQSLLGDSDKEWSDQDGRFITPAVDLDAHNEAILDQIEF